MKSFWKKPAQIPIVAGHRGSPAKSPENTISSFLKASEDGADAVELDIRLTLDREAVVIHDERLERTTNGTGLVRNHTVPELKQFSAGSWFSDEYTDEKIPTLIEVIGVLPPNIGVNIEIKSGLLGKRRYEIVDSCLKIIYDHHLEKRVLLSSFSLNLLKRIRQTDAAVPIGILSLPGARTLNRSIKKIAELGADYLITGNLKISRTIVDGLHAQNVRIGMYTVNRPEDIENSVQNGIDLIITDEPCKVLKFIKQRGAR
jgi:glycerophosphoryl diester phosphodiesterase